MKKRILYLILMLPLVMQGQVLRLDECRQMARQSNKQSEINREQVEAAKDLKRAAVANFFPKVSANGGYIWNEKNMSLLPSTLDTRLGTITAGQGVEWTNQQIASLLPTVSQQVGGLVAQGYEDLRNRLTLDIEHVVVGHVGVTQPIFVGGKVVNMYKIAKAGEHIAEMKAENDDADLMLKVDEAYWRVVSVQQKQHLAQQYFDLIKKVKDDVSALREEGLATAADELKVNMKLSEAEQKLGQAEDGLQLSRMALNQVCGLDLDYDIHVDSTGLYELLLIDDSAHYDIENAVAQRKEVQILEESERIAKSTVMLTASTLMPNIVANAGYLVSNPNLQDGFKNNFRGQFTAGVAVNIPIAHADDIYKVKAAKHEAKIVDLKLQQAKELLTLQTTQSRQKVSDAQRKLVRAQSACQHAQENLRLAEEAWKEGMLSSTELLGAQTAWMNAESDKLDAAIELRMAQSTLHKHIGAEI